MPRNICAFSEIVVACGQWPYFNIGAELSLVPSLWCVSSSGHHLCWVLVLFLGCGKLKSLFTVMLSVSVFVASTCVSGHQRIHRKILCEADEFNHVVCVSLFFVGGAGCSIGTVLSGCGSCHVTRFHAFLVLSCKKS